MVNQRMFWQPGQVEVFDSEEDVPPEPELVFEDDEEESEDQ